MARALATMPEFKVACRRRKKVEMLFAPASAFQTHSTRAAKHRAPPAAPWRLSPGSDGKTPTPQSGAQTGSVSSPRPSAKTAQDAAQAHFDVASFDWTTLRAVSKARTSCADGDLQ